MSAQSKKTLKTTEKLAKVTPENTFLLRHSIGGRILGGFAVMVAISLVVALAGIFSTSQSGTELSRYVGQDQKATSAVLRMERAIQGQFNSVRALLLLDNNPEIGESELLKARIQFDEAYKEFADLFNAANITRSSFNEIQLYYRDFTNVIEQIRVSSKQYLSSSKEYTERMARSGRDGLFRSIDQNLETYRDQIDQRIQDARNTSSLVTILSLVLVLLATVGGVIVSTIITRSITRPLGKLAQVAETVRQGDLSVGVPLSKGKDEVASLGATMASMTDNLRESQQNLEMALHDAEERNRELNAINRVSATVSSSLNLDVILNEALSELMAVTNMHYGSIFLMDETRQWLTLVTHRNQDEAYLNAMRQTRVGESLAGKVAEVGEVIILRADEPSDLYPAERWPVNSNKRFYLGIPLQSKGRAVGVVNLTNPTVQEISSRDIDLLKTIGNQIAIAIENAQLYNQAQQLAALEERNRLARDLHDSVTQTLFSVTLTAESARMMMDKKPERVEVQLERLQTLARGALAEMRALIFQLRPAALEEQGLVLALQKFTEALQSKEHIPIEFKVEGEKRLSNEHEQALYRIAQEALNNIVKHAQATQVSVELQLSDEEANMIIKDNGVGFDPQGEAAEKNRAQKSLGMTSMQERATLAGGTLTVESAPGQGTTIKVCLPLSYAPRPVGMGIN